MKFYIIRHGQSVANVHNLHQSDTTPLSELGKKQAQVLAHHCKSIPAEIILTSPFTRARQTATAIHEITGIPLEPMELLHETRKPSEITNRRHDHPEVLAIKHAIKTKRLENPRFRYSDEETFLEICERAHEALNILKSLDQQTVIVVTHEDFFKMLFAVMLLRGRVELKLFEKFEPFFKLHNASTSVFTYTPEKHWQMVAFNDTSYLPPELLT